MSLDYDNTIYFPVFGSAVIVNLADKVTPTTVTRTSVALTSSYQTESGTQPTKSFKTSGYSKLNLSLLYTTGVGETNNSVEIKFEESNDGVNWYRITTDTTSAGTSTAADREFTYVGAAAATAYSTSIGLDIFYPYMRVSAKETGVVTNAGTIYGEVTLLGM